MHFTKFHLAERACSLLLQSTIVAPEYSILQYSRSQKRFPAHHSNVGSVPQTTAFHSILVPSDGLQLIIPKFGRCAKPLYFTVLQLWEIACNSFFQRSVCAQSPANLSISICREGLQFIVPKFSRCTKPMHFRVVQLAKVLRSGRRKASLLALSGQLWPSQYAMKLCIHKFLEFQT
jgi:hypothetical protein